MGLKDKTMTKQNHQQVWVVRPDPRESGIDSIWDNAEDAARRANEIGDDAYIDDFLLNTPHESVLRHMVVIHIETGEVIEDHNGACQHPDTVAEMWGGGHNVVGYGTTPEEAEERAELFRMGYLSHKPKRKPRVKKTGGAVSIQ